MAKFLRRGKSKKEITRECVEVNSNADVQEEEGCSEAVVETDTDYIFEESPGEILDTRISHTIDTEVKARLEPCAEGDIEETERQDVHVESTLQKAQIVKVNTASSNKQREATLQKAQKVKVRLEPCEEGNIEETDRQDVHVESTLPKAQIVKVNTASSTKQRGAVDSDDKVIEEEMEKDTYKGKEINDKTSGRKPSNKKKKGKKSLDNGIDEVKEEESDAKTPSEKQAPAYDPSPIPLYVTEHGGVTESQVKFCQERVQQVEKNYGEMCQSFGSITRKSARLRDKGDILAKQVSEFAKNEKISHSTSKNMKEFAQNLAAIQDYRDAAIHRLENKVVKPLSAYGPKCKKVKSVIKTEQGAINKELKQRKQLEKVRDKKPGDEHAIAETEFKKAAADATIGSKALCTQMGMFEKEKLTDLKKVMADFVSIEMVFHAKAIEYYSQCFENLAMIDEEMDFDEFSRKMSVVQGGTMQLGTMPQEVPQATMQGTMQSMGSTGLTSTMGSSLGSTSEYTSTGASYTYTYGESTGSSTDKRVRIQTQSMYDDDDDEDDDDDDEDDDDDDDENGNPQHYSQPLRR